MNHKETDAFIFEHKGCSGMGGVTCFYRKRKSRKNLTMIMCDLYYNCESLEEGSIDVYERSLKYLKLKRLKEILR